MEVYKTVLQRDTEQVHILGVPLQRFHRLELEFRVITKQIASSANTADLAALKEYRDVILAEALEIVNRLKIPRPYWCGEKQARYSANTLMISK